MSLFHPPAACVLAAACLACSGSQAALVQTTQITPSTALGQYAYFSLDQLADGITSDDSPFNGYASGIGVTSGRITLALDKAYDLHSFVLWNDVNVLNEGVRSFTLEFVDEQGAVLGQTGLLLAVSQLAPQTYSFAAAVQGVKTVHLDVLSSNLQIEIRELAFNGEVSAVPEPATWATMLLGLAGVAALARRR